MYAKEETDMQTDRQADRRTDVERERERERERESLYAIKPLLATVDSTHFGE